MTQRLDRQENPLEAALSLLESGFPGQARRLLESAIAQRPNDRRLLTALEMIPVIGDDDEDRLRPQQVDVPLEVGVRRGEISRNFRAWLEETRGPGGRPDERPTHRDGPRLDEDDLEDVELAMGWRPANAHHTAAYDRGDIPEVPLVVRLRWWHDPWKVQVVGLGLAAVAALVVLGVATFWLVGYQRVAHLDAAAQSAFEAGDYSRAIDMWSTADALDRGDAGRSARIAAAREALEESERRRRLAADLATADRWEKAGRPHLALEALEAALSRAKPPERARLEARRDRLAAEILARDETRRRRRLEERRQAAQLVAEGRRAYEQRRYNDAESLYIEALRLDPERADVEGLLRLAREGIALAAEQRVAPLDPDTAAPADTPAETVPRPPAPPKHRAVTMSLPADVDRAELQRTVARLEEQRRRLVDDLVTDDVRRDPELRGAMLRRLRQLQSHLAAYRAALELPS